MNDLKINDLKINDLKINGLKINDLKINYFKNKSLHILAVTTASHCLTSEPSTYLPNCHNNKIVNPSEVICSNYNWKDSNDSTPELIYLSLVRAACVRFHGTKWPLLTAFFLFSLPGYFSPRGGYRRVKKFCMGSKLTKILRF